MLKQDVLDYFESTNGVARAIGKSKSTVSLWGNVIPWQYALLIEKLTNGALKYDVSFYPEQSGNDFNSNK
ncbi:Cro/CI family transcriptional regulator [Limnobaculum xujianqingii]|uniref:Cro/CI family transcriptional regulator n=1 Tax=Limnobaculum xujianqingii TaxID=2738837 RepID=UPI001126E701|nr:Cro/CI family transcriptional regulator [Limnobaculum xujianqingii]